MVHDHTTLFLLNCLRLLTRHEGKRQEKAYKVQRELSKAKKATGS